jgi:hypothetical protein
MFFSPEFFIRILYVKPEKIVVIPRKLKKPQISVAVVKIIEEAGACLDLTSTKRTAALPIPVMIIENIIETKRMDIKPTEGPGQDHLNYLEMIDYLLNS